MDEVSFPGEDPFDAIADVPCDLAHPQTIRHTGNPGDLDPASGQLNEEQHDVPLQSTPGPHFNREKIGGYDQLPVPAEELLPGGFPFALRRWFDAVLLQNVGNGATSQAVAEVGHCTENPPVSPITILLSHADYEVLDFVGGAWPTQSALGTAVILLGNQLAVPSQQCVRRNQVGFGTH